MSTAPYQEEEGSTFESNGVVYDLNLILDAVAHLPVLNIKVSLLKWLVRHVPDIDQARVERADTDVPILVTREDGRELVVDGFHRLVKGLKEGKTTLPYRRVTQLVLDKARLGPQKDPSWSKW